MKAMELGADPEGGESDLAGNRRDRLAVGTGPDHVFASGATGSLPARHYGWGSSRMLRPACGGINSPQVVRKATQPFWHLTLRVSRASLASVGLQPIVR